ncbi:MAG: hypothetical protein QXZ68_04970 [Candidatus Bathyarchaeia archaeon]
MTDSEWASGIVALFTGVLTIYIIGKVLIPQLRGLFAEIKPAFTELGKAFKAKKEEKAEEETVE